MQSEKLGSTYWRPIYIYHIYTLFLTYSIDNQLGPRMKSDDSKNLTPKRDESKQSREELLARAALKPSAGAAFASKAFLSQWGELDLISLSAELSNQASSVSEGSLRGCEEMLISQAHTLQAIFNNLAVRAAGSDDLTKMEAFLRLAMKAQGQCRATIKAIGDLKNPQPVAFVRQANIANGPQQINNGPTTQNLPPEKIENPPNELLENVKHDQLDAGTPRSSVPSYQEMGSVD